MRITFSQDMVKRWCWRVIDDDGNVIAYSSKSYPSHDAAAKSARDVAYFMEDWIRARAR